jgi:hypothetical protein
MRAFLLINHYTSVISGGSTLILPQEASKLNPNWV